MFRPEYIKDNVAAFGIYGCIELVAQKFRRMGKTRDMAHVMAWNLVYATVGA